MLYVLAVISISIAVFGRWIASAGRGPAWSAWLGYGQLATSAAAGWFAWTKLRGTYDALANLNPADRQALLRADLQTAMIALAIGSAIALIVALVLGAFWLRSTPRAT